MAQDTSDLNLTEEFEGYAKALPDGSCVAYWDAIGGVWTCGYGSTYGVTKDTHWTREQAVARIQSDWLKVKTGVLKASPVLSGYRNRLDAVTDFAYNVGLARYIGSSMHTYIARQDWQNSANEFPKWDISRGRKIAGLVRRRVAEQALFRTPDTPLVEPTAPPSADVLIDPTLLPSAPPEVAPQTVGALFLSFAKQLAVILRNRNSGS